MKFVSKDLMQSVLSFMTQNDGLVEYSPVPDKPGSLKLKWGDLWQISAFKMPEKVENVTYVVVSTDNEYAKLNTLCSIKTKSYLFKTLDNTHK